MNSWKKLGNFHPKSLTETRLQLHYAIQFMAAVGNFLTEPQSDYSHLLRKPRFGLIRINNAN